jgi:hypothetical protein
MAGALSGQAVCSAVKWGIVFDLLMVLLLLSVF